MWSQQNKRYLPLKESAFEGIDSPLSESRTWTLRWRSFVLPLSVVLSLYLAFLAGRYSTSPPASTRAGLLS